MITSAFLTHAYSTCTIHIPCTHCKLLIHRLLLLQMLDNVGIALSGFRSTTHEALRRVNLYYVISIASSRAADFAFWSYFLLRKGKKKSVRNPSVRGNKKQLRSCSLCFVFSSDHHHIIIIQQTWFVFHHHPSLIGSPLHAQILPVCLCTLHYTARSVMSPAPFPDPTRNTASHTSIPPAWSPPSP